MSNNQLKDPGSIFDFQNSNNMLDRGNTPHNGTLNEQSGWKNFPEHLTEEQISENITEETDTDPTEALLQKLIEENSDTCETYEQPISQQNDFLEEEYGDTDLTALIEQVSQQGLYSQDHLPASTTRDNRLSSPPPLPVTQTKYDQEGFHTGDFHHRLPAPVEFSQHGYNQGFYTPYTGGQQDQEQLKVEALERWLEKPTPEKDGSSFPTYILYSAACLAVVLLAYTGVYITGNYKSFDAPLLQVSYLFSGQKGDALPMAQSLRDAGSNEQISFEQGSLLANSSGQKDNLSGKDTSAGSSTHNKGNSSDGAGSSSGQPSVKVVSASTLLAVPELKSSVEECPAPNIILSALPGGFTAIKIESSCRSDQNIDIGYGGISYKTRFDQRGNLSFILDCFVGDKSPVLFQFQDGKQQSRKPVLEDMGMISKVAVIWDSPDDLNLHAFEYAAGEDSKDHVWEKNPLSLETATSKMQSVGVGHGFISSSSGISRVSTQKIEVYTFIHSPEEKDRPGVIKLALEHIDTPKHIQKVSCDSDGSVFLKYQTTQFVRNSILTKDEGQLVVEPCQPRNGRTLMTKAVRDLIVGG